MAFKPANVSASSGFAEYRPSPVPRAGLRKARVSLIVDMGTQEREDFVDEKTGESKPQDPVHQVAVFVDLVADTVDYGGDIGKQHYRLSLNKEFAGEFKGINFKASYPRDAAGERIPNRGKELHVTSPLYKLARAAGVPSVIESTNIEELLGKPFMAQVEVRETQNKQGKKDKDGNVIVYKNVSYKGPVTVPEDDDGNPVEVAELKVEPKLISFNDAKAEDIYLIRAALLKRIKQALNYSGSQMQKAVMAYEASIGKTEATEAPVAQAKPAAIVQKAKPVVEEPEDFEDDVPF